jgi:hypothetical protein
VESEGPSIGKVGECDVESWHLQSCRPRLCRLRTDGLAPTASLVSSEEKLGTNLWIGQPSCCGLCRELFFSGVVVLLNSVDDYAECCYALTA